jgi:hypothetical protein
MIILKNINVLQAFFVTLHAEIDLYNNVLE